MPSRKEHGWDYKMFKFAPGFLGPQHLEREATLLKQRLTSALVWMGKGGLIKQKKPDQKRCVIWWEDLSE